LGEREMKVNLARPREERGRGGFGDRRGGHRQSRGAGKRY
jgi:hypothetical protein